MSQFDHYKVEILPYNYTGMHGGVERVYQVTVEMNGEKMANMMKVPGNAPSYISELDYVARLTQDIIRRLDTTGKIFKSDMWTTGDDEGISE
jgi:hypothetical protein